MSRNRETTLLLTAIRAERQNAARAQVVALLEGGIDWTLLVETADRHGVTAFLFQRLLELSGAAIPAEIAAAARIHLQRHREWNQARLGELGAILATLERHQVAAIPLKGPVLGLLVYGDACIRNFRDLDVLVNRADFARARAALAEIGYQTASDLTPRQDRACLQRYGQAIYWRQNGGVPVEPHWALTSGTFALDLDYAQMWHRSLPMEFDGRIVRRLDAEDMVLALCVHGTKEQWSRLQWLCDLAWAIHAVPALNWQELVARAERQRCQRVLLLSLQLAHELLEADLPEMVAARIAAERPARDLARQAATAMFEARRPAAAVDLPSRFHMRSHDHAADQMRYLWRTLVTPREAHFRMVRLPDSAFGLYYPIKVIHDYLLLPAWLLVKRIRGPGRR
jgi:hypothetical protein